MHGSAAVDRARPAASGPADVLSVCQPGVTLIELIIAISVLTFAVMSLLTMIPTTTLSTRDSNEHEIARHAAEGVIAGIRSSGLASAPNTFMVGDLRLREGMAEHGSVTVADGPDGPNGAKQVTVRVDWRDRVVDGQNKRIEIITLIR